MQKSEEARLTILRKVMNAYRGIEPITDAELRVAINLLDNLVKTLRVCGERYQLAVADLDRILTQFEGFEDARKRG